MSLLDNIAICTEGRYQRFNQKATGTPDLDTFRRVVDEFVPLGFTNFEVVAITLADDPLALSASERDAFRRVAEECGARIKGLHWLLAGMEGVHLTDPACREKTSDTIVSLLELTRDLGGDLVVHGSPGQRTLRNGIAPQAGFDAAVAVYCDVMERAADFGVLVCFEQLSRLETDFIVTQEELLRLIEAVGHELFVGHIDVKALYPQCQNSSEAARVILDFGRYAGHCHLNDPLDGEAPSCGPGVAPQDRRWNFVPILKGLRKVGWDRPWVKNQRQRTLSIEVFDFETKDLAETAKESLRYLRRCLELAEQQMA